MITKNKDLIKLIGEAPTVKKVYPIYITKDGEAGILAVYRDLMSAYSKMEDLLQDHYEDKNNVSVDVDETGIILGD